MTEKAQVRTCEAARDDSSCTAASAATVSVDDANSKSLTSPSESAPDKCIHFNEHLYLVLLRSIIAVKVHVAERWTYQHKFEES